ncbi:MAG: hypothetical protein EB101_04780 [Chitinophagia bacterium]|nr:hypothetical protein [Chitinophagia bacterium]
MTPAGLGGLNQEPFLGIRRVAQMDDANRVASQIEHDRGAYLRPAVGPVEYSEGNIKKSTALTGPAGYNQRAVPLPDSPDDMSQAQYLMALEQATPAQRMRMQASLAGAKQNFLNTRLAQTEYPLNTHNMVDNLMSIARAKLNKGK